MNESYREEKRNKEAIIKPDKLKKVYNAYLNAPTLRAKCDLGIAFIDTVIPFCNIDDAVVLNRRRSLMMKYSDISRDVEPYIFGLVSSLVSHLLKHQNVTKYLMDETVINIIPPQGSPDNGIGRRVPSQEDDDDENL